MNTLHAARPPSAATLADHPFFSAIPITSLRRVATHAYRADYAPGETIFTEGGVADRFFLIRRGLVRLDMEIAGPGQIELETIGADAALGWSWLVAPHRWHLSATAVARTSTLAIDATTLRALMSADPVLGYELTKRLAAVMFDRLQMTRRRLTSSLAAPTPIALP
jgi:CRP-like cAMP-binding protein